MLSYCDGNFLNAFALNEQAVVRIGAKDQPMGGDFKHHSDDLQLAG
jgi:hypothetical protein